MSGARTGCSQITAFPVSLIHLHVQGELQVLGLGVDFHAGEGWESRAAARGSSSLSSADPCFGASWWAGVAWAGVTGGTGRVWRGAPVGTQTQRAGLCIGVYLSH